MWVWKRPLNQQADKAGWGTWHHTRSNILEVKTRKKFSKFQDETRKKVLKVLFVPKTMPHQAAVPSGRGGIWGHTTPIPQHQFTPNVLHCRLFPFPAAPLTCQLLFTFLTSESFEKCLTRVSQPFPHPPGPFPACCRPSVPTPPQLDWRKQQGRGTTWK